MRHLRVLHVIQNLNYGGMERLLADLVLRADPAEFEPHVLVLQYLGRFARELEGRAALHVSPPLPKWSLVCPRLLARQLRSIAPDVVHSHSGVWLKTARAAHAAGVPRLIHTEHGRASPDPLKARLLDGLASRYTDVVVAVSEVLARQLEATVVRGRAPIQTIPNGVDTEHYRPRADTGRLRAELGLSADTPIIGSIGRLEAIKGYDVMIAAFANLPAHSDASFSPPHLVVAGDGAERAQLEAMAARLGAADRVHWLGWRDDPIDLFSAFTIFTMASRSEGTSVSLLEAMSSGLCPVVTQVGGNSAVLGGELRHRLVPTERPEALAMAWRDALGHPDRRESDAATARRRVVEAFGISTMVRSYEALYRQG
ncbi:MAG TPA: glycosyltransferase [Gemmatimonadales bacterium]|jgi:glycosyltransferase involved in cell wall biosynthesis|nr:glycosyltransferase [Gemmatimonadales bacterium]